jgi:DNA-binding protein YbaB
MNDGLARFVGLHPVEGEVPAIAPSSSQRPDWSALEGMVGDLRNAMRHAEDTQRKVLAVSGTAWSDDRLVKAVVGPRGHLVELEINPRVYRTPNSVELAAKIVATVRRATEDAMAKTQEIIAERVPADVRLQPMGSLDVDKLLRTPDADLMKEIDDGHQ